MSKDFIKKDLIGSAKEREPKAINEILAEYFSRSNESLAVACRKRMVEQQLFRDIFPNTEVGVDLKLLTREAGRLEIGELIAGAITRDGEEHFTSNYTLHDFLLEAADELRMLAGLIEECNGE